MRRAGRRPSCPGRTRRAVEAALAPARHGARLAAVVALLLPAAGCQSGEEGGGLDLERMIRQPSLDAYEPSGLFDDRRSMREPPEGTIARDDEGSAAAPARSGRLGTAWLEEIPLELTMELMERGRERFAVYCAPCHGFDGNANTPVAAAMELTPPPSLHSDRAREHPPGMLYAVVQRGFGLMPGYGYQLPVRDRWAVVAYVRALQLSAGVSLDSLPADVRSEIEERLPPGPDAAEAAR